MKPRINVFETAKGQSVLKTLYGFGRYLSQSSIEPALLHLIEFRVSQVNGCAFCLDMHSKDLRAEGETEQRLYVLDAWREAPFYTDRERAALAWAESLTKIPGGQVADEVYEEARRQFTEEEMIDLTMCILAINSWNRLNIAFRSAKVGSYQPGAFAQLA